jgi:hypothetical protein
MAQYARAQVLVPITIVDSMVTACNVAEPDATRGEVAWNPATYYAIDTEVVRTTTHRVYTATASGVDAGLPENTPTRWKNTRPTNKHAAYDYYRSTTIKKNSTLTLTLKPGVITGMQFFGLVGDVLTVVCKDASTGVPYSTKTYSLANYLTGDLEWNFWFGTPKQQDRVRITGLVPHDAQVEITLTVSVVTGTAEIGILALGFWENLGDPKLGFTVSPKSYAYIDVDKDTGEAMVVPGLSANDLEGDCWLDASEAQAVYDVICSLLGTPCAWVISDMPGFNYLSAFGLGKAKLSAPEQTEANLAITIEGFI